MVTYDIRGKGEGTRRTGGYYSEERRRKRRYQEKPAYRATAVSPHEMTSGQRAEVARQRADREARGGRPGTGGSGLDYQPPRGKQTVEMKRFTPEEYKALMPEEKKKWYQAGEGGSIFTDEAGLREKMHEPVTARQVAEATALGLTIAAGGYGLAARGATLALAGGSARATLSKAAAGQVSKKIVQYTQLGGGRVAINTYTAAKTTSWLSRLTSFAGTPTGVISIIGSYPFAGFIKEEALQTLSFAFNSAEKNKDLEGMQLSLQEQRQLLDPDMWAQIFDAIPYANVLAQLKKFYKAATTKYDINQKGFLKMSAELGEVQAPGVPIE